VHPNESPTGLSHPHSCICLLGALAAAPRVSLKLATATVGETGAAAAAEKKGKNARPHPTCPVLAAISSPFGVI
jgi:hypothetical protein